jgi:serine/threonine protein kinase
MGSNVEVASSLPKPGDVLAGKYRVDRLLGAGGMGAVVAATHMELGHRVAVKVMLPHLTGQASLTARFLREARALIILRNEHLARVFDAGRLDGGAPFMVMELLAGNDLEQLSRARGPLSVEEATGYMIQACDALVEAHRHGVVHRDMKPSNLFVARSPMGTSTVKLLDFGISTIGNLQEGIDDAAALTATDAVLGSPLYMSPEQLRASRSVDARSDIWGLGMILHKLLTGKLAFEAQTMGEHLMKIIGEPPVPLRQRRPDAPAELEAVILRCLEKDLERRFQTVGEVAAALAPFAPPEVNAILSRIAVPASDVPRAEMQGGGVTGAPRAFAPDLAANQLVDRTGVTWSPDAAKKTKDSPRARRLVVAGAVSLTAGSLTVAILWKRLPPSTAEPPPAALTGSPSATLQLPIAAPSSPVDAPPPAKTEVSIWLAVEPLEAVLELDGVPTRLNPLRLPRSDRIHTVTVRAQGHVTETRDVSAQGDGMLTVSLKRQGGRATTGPPRAVTASTAPASTPAVGSGKVIRGPIEPDL